MPYLRSLIPEQYGRYYEPFLGSGALYFYLKPTRATLSDASSELIGVWRSVRDNPAFLIDYLAALKPDKSLFYKIRENRSDDELSRSAEFLYLNKTCWNGLYRVNSKGKFNVPYGAPRTDNLIDPDNLRECSKLLQNKNISISNRDFSHSLNSARRDDLVFLDPPYVTKHNNNGFKDYNEKIFSWEDQIRLAKLSELARLRGVKIIISNAHHSDVESLYPNFSKYIIERPSTLSSSSRFRGRVTEIVMTANISGERYVNR